MGADGRRLSSLRRAVSRRRRLRCPSQHRARTGARALRGSPRSREARCSGSRSRWGKRPKRPASLPCSVRRTDAMVAARCSGVQVVRRRARAPRGSCSTAMAMAAWRWLWQRPTAVSQPAPGDSGCALRWSAARRSRSPSIAPRWAASMRQLLAPKLRRCWTALRSMALSRGSHTRTRGSAPRTPRRPSTTTATTPSGPRAETTLRASSQLSRWSMASRSTA